MSQVQVGFLSAHNYLDRNAWSGTVYRMYQALKSKDFQLLNLGNPKTPSLWQKIQDRFQQRITPVLMGATDDLEPHQKFADQIHQQIHQNNCDVIFAPVASGEISFLNTNIPIVYLSDATPKLIKDTYNLYASEAEFQLSEQQEKIAMSKADKLIYSSDWVANSAVSDYGANPDKIEVIPFGANVDSDVVPQADKLLKKCQDQTCRLLFIGKDWQRKGGQIAFETLEALNHLGVEAELVFLGCVPPDDFQHPKLKVIPFLNKNVPQEQEQFSQLLLESHFLLFPTRADCSPIVICEANAFGLPVITTNVGGIPTIIQNGENGYTFSLTASGDDYARLIADIFSDKTRYEQLVRSARQTYEMRLNWDKWGDKMRQVITCL